MHGGRLNGDTVHVKVGGALDLVSPQDWSRTRGFSASGSVLIGPGYVGPESASYGQTTGDKAWTDVSEIVGKGDTVISVGGNLNLVGATIASASDKLDLRAGSLTWSNLADRNTFTSTSFGVSGLSGVLSTSQPTAGGSSLVGGLQFGYQNDNTQGVTFAVIGEGQVRIGDATGADAVGEIKRDASGRQIITVSDHTHFAVDIPLVNFQQLAANASSAVDLLRAVTTPVPDTIQAQGPAASDYFQRLIAGGASPDEAADLLATPRVQKLVTMQTELDKAITAYGSVASIPPGVRSAIAEGMTLDYTEGLPRIISACDTSGTGCQFSIINPQGIEQARVLVRDAENKLAEKLPEYIELQLAFKEGRATPEIRLRFNLLQAELEEAARTYALCADNVGRPPIWAISADYSDSTMVRRIMANAAEFVQKKDTYYSGRIETADEVFALIPPLAYSRGIATLASVMQSGVRSFVVEGGEILSQDAVAQLLRTGLAYVDTATGELVVRQSSEAFLTEMARGRAREALVGAELRLANPAANMQREVYLRTADGEIARDAAGNARRIDFAVIENGQVIELREVTSLTAKKGSQTIKETYIRDQGGTFIRDRNTGALIDISGVPTRLDRRP